MSQPQNGGRSLSGAILIIERIAGIVLGLVTVLIVASSIGRYLFASPIADTFDVSRLVLGVAIAWGLASLGYHGTHIKVDLLAHSLPRKLRNALNFFAWSVLLGFTLLLVWKIWERVQAAMSGGDATMELRLAHWPFFLGIWLGILAAVFTTAIRLWLIAREGRDLGEYDGIDEHLLEDIKKS
ncbi:TRAP transporter small permease [Phaeobacter sp. 22II1-1F12B]|uniref:TRAP transporter small permease n=1 Tax=Phaeobacter sp. 22II1-1F12B TaxID=1317111 RepID=UPI000B51E7E8|nr:TRAP transporter small permease [Phaeobacter sp. 22II1-1F12B]OWU78206.1 C4-dicarboxylate ABC transporter [Phaeobacter sp. 22II1-1F12B]